VLTQSSPPAVRGENHGWGWLFPLLVVGATGTLAVAVADGLARSSDPRARLVFYAGLVLTYVPLALRAVSPGASRRERIALLAALGLLLSLVKVLMQPAALIYFDELMHYRSLLDLQQSGHLFGANPLLGISPYYPGLESATAALIGATGLPAAIAAEVVVRAAKLLAVLALYLFLERVTGSSRGAAAGTAVYMANPGFVFFDSQFAYESMALGLGAVVLFVAARRLGGDAPTAGSLLVVALVGLALAVTHHVTGYALLAFMTLWAVAALCFGRSTATRLRLLPLALAVLAAEAAWFAVAGRSTLEYLSGDLLGAGRDAIALLQHHSGSRHLFQASGGQSTPLALEALGLGSAALLVLALPLGAAGAWKQLRLHPTSIVLGLTAVAYAGSLGLHLAAAGADIAARISPFVFVAVAGILAFAVGRAWPRDARSGPRSALLAAWLSVVFLGGLVVGWQPAQQLPGPYLAGADGRSVDPVGVCAAQWSGGHLGTGNRVVADVTNRNLLGSYGQQDPVTYYNSGVATAPLVLSPTFDDGDLAIVRDGHVRYVVVDRRLSTARPLIGLYFEDGEPATLPSGAPIPVSWLDKFDAIPGVSRVYDNGEIRIYDLGGLSS
jgi:hypothetical protein